MLAKTSRNETMTTKARTVGPFARIFLASLFAHLGIFLFIHLPDYMKGLGATETVIGASASVSALFAVLARPIVGRIMDTRGRRAPLIVGGILHAVTCALYLTVRAPDAWLFIVRALQGVAGGTFFSVAFTVASDLAPSETRTQKLAIFGISGILPMSLAALLGDFIAGHAGYPALFAVAAAFATTATLLAVSVPETAPPRDAALIHDPLAAFRVPALRWLWVSGLLFAIPIASYFVFAKNFIVGAHLGQMATFFTPYAVVAIMVRVLFGDVPHRVGEANTYPAAVLLLALGLAALSAAEGPVTIAIAGLLCGLGHAFAFPSLMSLFVERSPAAIRGSVVAMFTALMDMGQLAAGPLFGRTADHHGFRVVFQLAAGIALLGFACFVLRARKLPATQELRIEAGTRVD